MSATPGVSALAPFRVRSFRFQWPADLAASCAFEMETLILGWYVLVETGSVLLLTLFASLQYIGTLLAPMFGVAGHRIGNKKLLCIMLALSRAGHAIRPGRMMIIFCAVWYALIMAFAQMKSPPGGIAFLMLCGLAQSLSLVPMLAMLLRTSDAEFRGRVVGLRMMAVYGVPIGLMISGPLIGRFGYPATAALYCLISLVFTLLIAVRWRDHLWRAGAPANLR